jgi:hypothetical protein
LVICDIIDVSLKITMNMNTNMITFDFNNQFILSLDLQSKDVIYALAEPPVNVQCETPTITEFIDGGYGGIPLAPPINNSGCLGRPLTHNINLIECIYNIISEHSLVIGCSIIISIISLISILIIMKGDESITQNGEPASQNGESASQNNRPKPARVLNPN